jgi:GNAT superfamily N-acetyltransferase
MTTGRVVVKKVDASKEAISHCILWLQTTCLPHDEPRALKGDEWWIAYQDGLPVAFAAMRMINKTDAYLSRAGVLPAARGHGIQKRLIRARVQYAKKQGVTTVLTDTTDNPASANSLISQGFRMHNPQYRWATPSANYWIKTIKGQ